MKEMSNNKFSDLYTIVEVIKSDKLKSTSIVRDNGGKYFISKKIQLNYEQAFNEIEMMQKTKHPNIVSFHDLIVEKNHVYLIEEFCEEGDLNFHIHRQIRKQKTYFLEENVRKWLLQLLLAIEYLHNCKIMHRDIRPQNIFLTSQGNIKLGSLRLSKFYDDERELTYTHLGTHYYMTPECIESGKYDLKIDIWAYGCVLYELCTLTPIFSSKNIVELTKNILNEKKSELPQSFSRNLNNILKMCLTKNPLDRPAAKELLRTPYFLEGIRKVIEQKGQKGSCQSRIPIRKYRVHKQNLQRKKAKLTPKPPKSKEKIYCPQTPILPRILEVQSSRPSKKSVNKEYRKDLSAEKLREESKEKVRVLQDRIRQKIRSRSKQVSRGKNNYNAPQQEQTRCTGSYIIIKNAGSREKRSSQNSREKKRDIESFRSEEIIGGGGKDQPSNNNEKVIKSHESIEENKKKKKGYKTEKDESENSPQNLNKMMPPLLPRPHYKKNEKSQEDKYLQFSQTKKKGQLEKELANFRMVESTQNEVKDRLEKIFEELNIEENEEQQFSFDLEDQNLARLTLKDESDGGELISTYKRKLAQLIEEINYKYCPNMETIQEKTQEFDSNTFGQKISYS